MGGSGSVWGSGWNRWMDGWVDGWVKMLVVELAKLRLLIVDLDNTCLNMADFEGIVEEAPVERRRYRKKCFNCGSVRPTTHTRVFYTLDRTKERGERGWRREGGKQKQKGGGGLWKTLGLGFFSPSTHLFSVSLPFFLPEFRTQQTQHPAHPLCLVWRENSQTNTHQKAFGPDKKNAGLGREREKKTFEIAIPS